MAHKSRCCFKLSEKYVDAGNVDCLKATPNMFSLENKSDLAWEILFVYLRHNQHIAHLYNQGKMTFTLKSPTRDWKQLGCNMYSSQWKDTSQMHLCSGKQHYPFSPLECSYTLQEINQCVSSWNLGNGSVHSVFIPWKALHTVFPWRTTLHCQENSFFSISGINSTELDHKIRSKSHFTNTTIQSLEAYWIYCIITSLNATQPHCDPCFGTARILLYLGHRNQSGLSSPWRSGLV